MTDEGDAQTDATRRTLVLIGYWAGPDDDEWPHPADLVDETWDARERSIVARYLEHGVVANVWMGCSPSRLCDRTDNGALELTDGTCVWPEGLAHYVVDHHVRLPQRFVDHVRESLRTLQDATIDPTWWREATGAGAGRGDS